jgi:hypothetical protein
VAHRAAPRRPAAVLAGVACFTRSRYRHPAEIPAAYDGPAARRLLDARIKIIDFGDFVARERRERGLTIEEVRGWRPEKKARRAGWKKKAAALEVEG